MRILLAVSDRDLLRSYTTLLTMEGHEVTAVFDGTQAISRMSTEAFDTLIVEESLPRVSQADLMRVAEQRRISTLLLTNTIQEQEATMTPRPSAILAFPFAAEELTALLATLVSIPDQGDEIS